MADSRLDRVAIARRCAEADPGAGLACLASGLNDPAEGLAFEHVTTRGNWHRLGGVVDADQRRISENISHWLEQESGGDIDGFIARYQDAGYMATRLAGKTHYFTMPIGEQPEEFLQLEVEELQEVLDRPLIWQDWYPDSLEELLDPLDYPRSAPAAVGKPYYCFRRLTSIPELIKNAPIGRRSTNNLKRFLQDWRTSSASEAEPFCRLWVLALREYQDAEGLCRHSVKPVSVFTDKLPTMPSGEQLSGAELANAIHGYDRNLGFPFAWYFTMLSHKTENLALAEAVLRDQMGAYDYLPARDLKVLRAWEVNPYAV